MAERLERYLTSSEVARLVQVSARTVNRWADAGRIRCVVTLGGHRRFPPEEVDRVLNQMTVGRSSSVGALYDPADSRRLDTADMG